MNLTGMIDLYPLEQAHLRLRGKCVFGVVGKIGLAVLYMVELLTTKEGLGNHGQTSGAIITRVTATLHLEATSPFFRPGIGLSPWIQLGMNPIVSPAGDRDP